MIKTIKTIVLFTCLITLMTSCSLFRVHKLDVQQGNYITPEMVDQLRTGMTRTQVTDIMGTPLLSNTFTPNRVDYVYTYKPGYGDLNGKTITLIFRNGRLQAKAGNLYSTYMK